VVAASGTLTELTGFASEGIVQQRLGALFRDEQGRDLERALADLGREAPGVEVASFHVRSRQAPDAGSLALSVLKASADRLAAVVSRRPAPDEIVSLLESSWESVQEGMALTTPAEGPRGPVIVAVNRMFGMLFGITPERAHGRPLAAILDAARADDLVASITSQLAKGAASDLTMVRDANDAQLLVEWELSPVRSPDGQVRNLVCILRDVTEASIRSRNQRRPDSDPLTGLPNRAHFLRQLARSVERAAHAREYTFAVAGIDLDGFDTAQRRLGPVISHFVMEALIWRVKQCLRPGDLIGRIGPYRLAVLLDHFGPWGNLERVLGRLRRSTEEPYTVGGDQVRLSVVGGAVSTWEGGHFIHDAQSVMDELDRALARARASPVSTRASSPLESDREPRSPDLTRASELGQLHLHYMPVVSLDGESVVGLEALIRWNHPLRGLLGSREVIAEAERSDRIVWLGRWIITQACRQLGALQSQAPQGGSITPIHVNLSAADFWHPDLAEFITQQVHEWGVDPSLLRLEVHESTLAASLVGAHKVLSRLREVGVDIWLDGFGEGGLPLNRLSDMPIQCVKLDPAVIWHENGEDEARPAPLLPSLIMMAHDLGWSIVGSGVETAQQRDVLIAQRCDLGQGFFFSQQVDFEVAGESPLRTIAQPTLGQEGTPGMASA
jgi:diguanylate cyclase (GGDEF)-like protein/PAS domain S-box-containing protein